MRQILLGFLILTSGVSGFALAQRGSSDRPFHADSKETKRAGGASGAVTGPVSKSHPESDAAPSSTASPVDSTPILDHFLPDLTEEQLEQMIFGAMLRNKETSLVVVDLFFRSPDPAIHDLVKKSLLRPWFLHVEVIVKCLEGMRLEQHRGRQLILAEVLGEHPTHDEVGTFIEETLSGRDDELKDRLLENLDISRVYGERRERIATQLRELALNGRSDSLRAAAVWSMRGVETETAVRFQLDRALNDPALEVRRCALNSVPRHFSEDEQALGEEVMLGLYSLFKSPQTPQELRKTVAYKLAGIVGEYKGEKLTEAQREEVRIAWEAYDTKSKETKP